MSDLSGLVSGIEAKLKKLIAVNTSLASENSGLKLRQTDFIKKIEEQEKYIEHLTEKNNYLKIAKSVKQAEGNAEIKKKIDELVREIDKCIGLLNK
jgi:regulator of replication initiation timing